MVQLGKSAPAMRNQHRNVDVCLGMKANIGQRKDRDRNQNLETAPIATRDYFPGGGAYLRLIAVNGVVFHPI